MTRIRPLIVVSLLALALGCAASRPHVEDTSAVTSLAGAFSRDALTDGGLVILPVLVTQKGRLVNPLATQLATELQEKFPIMRTVSWQECDSLVNQADLDSSWRDALETVKTRPIINNDSFRQVLQGSFGGQAIPDDVMKHYVDSNLTLDETFWKFRSMVFSFEDMNPAIPAAAFLEFVPVDAAVLSKVGEMVRARYVMQVDINHFKDSMGFNVFRAIAETRQTQDNFEQESSSSESASFGAFCHIWDCVVKRLVWSGFATTYSSTTDERNEHVSVAARGIVAELHSAGLPPAN